MKKISFAITTLALSSALIAACGGAGAPAAPAAAPANQAANANGAAPAGGAPAGAPDGGPSAGAPGAPGANGQRGGFANIKRAAELPTENPVVSGPILSHSSNTLMVRTGFGRRGQGQGQATPLPGPTATLAPPLAVEIDASTKIYSDTTVFDPAAAQNGQEIQQTVTLVSSLDALNLHPVPTPAGGGGNGGPGGAFANNEGFVQVWGDTSTGKLVATTILYSRQRGGGRQRPQGTPTASAGG